MAHDAESIKQHVRVYINVFVALGVLTLVTVGVSYVHLDIYKAIVVAMIVALIKGTLVAGYFMHLFSERRTIHYTLALCVCFFAVLLFVPKFTDDDNVLIHDPAHVAAVAGAHHAADHGSEAGTEGQAGHAQHP
ncbi:MAG: hypothetical protein CHACPFDD_02773 [Phycisphaerae bacterium]|nr:hypothetical protein [Phycisphaerae bacterium]